MANPTVGRIVWYHPSPDDPGPDPHSAPLAAIIAFVWSPVLINIVVFDTNGKPYSKTSVPLFDLETAPDRPFGFAEWPVYGV